MKVKELIICLKTCKPSAEIKFSDVCGNWEFTIEGFDDSDSKNIYLIGDRSRD